MGDRVHFEGDLDIRHMRKGAWTSKVRLIRTAKTGLPVCLRAVAAWTDTDPEKVTCKRCLELIEKHVDTMLNAPVSAAFVKRSGLRRTSATGGDGT